jgi:hypothetical protein
MKSRKKEPTQLEFVTNMILTAIQLMIGVRIIDVVTRPDRSLKGMAERLEFLESRLITLHILATDEVIRP